MYFREAKLKRSRWELRDIGELYNLEEEDEIEDNEITELDNQKEVAEKEDVEEISPTQEEKKRQRKN